MVQTYHAFSFHTQGLLLAIIITGKASAIPLLLPNILMEVFPASPKGFIFAYCLFLFMNSLWVRLGCYLRLVTISAYSRCSLFLLHCWLRPLRYMVIRGNSLIYLIEEFA